MLKEAVLVKPINLLHETRVFILHVGSYENIFDIHFPECPGF